MVNQNVAINYAFNCLTKVERWKFGYMRSHRKENFEKAIIEYLEANNIDASPENVAYFKEKLARKLNFKRR